MPRERKRCPSFAAALPVTRDPRGRAGRRPRIMEGKKLQSRSNQESLSITSFAIQLLLWQKALCSCSNRQGKSLPGEPGGPCMMPGGCQPHYYRAQFPLSRLACSSRLLGWLHTGGQGRREVQAHADSAALPCLVQARHKALFDLSPLPVLEGLRLSQLQKRAGGYLAMDE